MAFHALYFAYLFEPIANCITGDLAFLMDFIVAIVLALTILYPSPLLAESARVARVTMLVLISHGVGLGAMLSNGILWVIICLALGIPPREA